MKSTAQRIGEHLDLGEQLVWSGQPVRGLKFRRGDILLVPFSLVWGGFAFFWEAAVVASNAPFFAMLWGVPFVLIGLYMIVGRFFYDAHRRANTHYGVTSERIVILVEGMGGSLRTLERENLSDVTVSMALNNIGTITFGPDPADGGMSLEASGWPMRKKGGAPRFELLKDAEAVHRLIRDRDRSAKSQLGTAHSPTAPAAPTTF